MGLKEGRDASQILPPGKKNIYNNLQIRQLQLLFFDNSLTRCSLHLLKQCSLIF